MFSRQIPSFQNATRDYDYLAHFYEHDASTPYVRREQVWNSSRNDP
jgi:hypothetical protein